jgi:hypothetical protein
MRTGTTIRAAVALLALCASLQALAQSATLLRADTLRAEPFADAAAVASAAAGDALRIVERKGTWSLVESSGKRGWVRALNLKAEAASSLKREGVLALETGRQAQGGVTVPLAIRQVSVPGDAARLLEELFERRDKAQQLKVSATRAGDGSIALNVLSPRAGYAYVFMANNAGSTLQCVFPNLAQPDNDVRPGRSLALPAGGWKVAPEGAVRLLAVVTDAPLDLLIEDKQAEGPLFSMSVNADNKDALRKALTGGAAYAAAAATLPARR